MPEGRDAGSWEGLEDPRMWRLMLARLHPDAGGDEELFAFACAVKEEVHRERPPVRRAAGARGESRARHWERRAAEGFLEDWQWAMSYWSLRNREALRSTRHR
ncbi:hypothetical protein [Rubrobacter aplysinae]|uniref:hypothetical protein n=1 Tax=Rubrobacter aplysinae TaxID=909625 RepID=UPI00064C291E|nr:hypothetical protein [Rubrobacter aplysinae]